MMNTQESLRIVSSLAEGFHPASNQPFPPGSVYHDAEIVRALFAASLALAELDCREKRKNSLPRNTGKNWSPDEDQKLLQGYDSGESLKLLAAEHQRSTTAVRLRLVKLGRLEDSPESK